MLVGTDRLDRPLTIGQMQGKFQPVLLPQVRLAVGLVVTASMPQCVAAGAWLLALTRFCFQCEPYRPVTSCHPADACAAGLCRGSACKLTSMPSLAACRRLGTLCTRTSRTAPQTPLPPSSAASGEQQCLATTLSWRQGCTPSLGATLTPDSCLRQRSTPLPPPPLCRIGEPPLQIPRPAAGVPRVLPVPIGPAFAPPAQQGQR